MEIIRCTGSFQQSLWMASQLYHLRHRRHDRQLPAHQGHL